MLLFYVLLLVVIKDTIQGRPNRRDAQGWVWREGQAFQSPSQHLDVFTDLEALRILLFRGFMGVHYMGTGDSP